MAYITANAPLTAAAPALGFFEATVARIQAWRMYCPIASLTISASHAGRSLIMHVQQSKSCQAKACASAKTGHPPLIR